MARRKNIENMSYDEMILYAYEDLAKLEENFATIKEEIKNKKAEIKRLEKEKIANDEKLRQEEEKKKIQELVQHIIDSGKSYEEIEAYLKK